ncbi:MAG: TonB-dependent receptor [Ginsengibacter sp.]
MQNFNRKITVTLFLFGAINAFAQTDSATFKNLDEVVVTGQYAPQSLKNSVYQVKVINNEKIRLSNASNIQQVLNTQLRFRFSNDNTLGITDVKLNGIGGNNVKILLDGVPMVDRYDQRVSLSQIDINNIERIEIVEGPMSVSFGSDAMAGVINIITKKLNKDQFSINALAREETVGNEYFPLSYKGVHVQNLNANFSKKHFVSSIGFTHNDFNGFEGDEYGRGKSWKPKEQWMGNARVGYVNDHLNVYYRIDGLKENILVRNPINLNNYKAIDQKYITDRYIHQLQSEYRLNDKMTMNGFFAYTNYQRETTTTRRNFETNKTEPNQPGEEDISTLNSVAFKASLQYRISSKISFQPGIDFNHEKADGARIEGSPEINDYAVFISSEIKPNSFISIRPGLRFSNNSEYDAPPIIPSINTKFALNKELDLRLAYGYGFRAPTLRELYLNFIDVNHNLVGNKDLKAEYSNSINGSLTYSPVSVKNILFSSTLSGFYTAFRNQVELLENVKNPIEYTYYNTDKSKTLGGSIENVFEWKNLDIGIGFSYIGYSSSQFDDENLIKMDHRDLLWTPEINTNITYRLDKLKTKLALFYKYTGNRPSFSFGKIDSKDAILLTHTSAYQFADFSTTTEIHKMLTLHLGVKNIFDVTNVQNNTVSISNTEHSRARSLPMGYGRSFFAGLSFNWNKSFKK